MTKSFLQARLLGAVRTLCLSMVLTQAVLAAAPEFDFNIPETDLASALKAFADVTQESVVFTAELTAKRTSRQLHGSFTANEAIERMLEGSGLIAERASSGVILIKRGEATPPTATQSTASAGTTQEATAPSQSEREALLDEVLVTAQRRAERSQDVPISITVHTGESLQDAGISNARDLTYVTPGLTMDSAGNSLQPAIRGVTTTYAEAGADANVAMYLDGIYLGAQTSTALNLPDVRQIEVSKGPQGTLFGRNATGGAIQIHTLSPSFTPKGKISASYGRFDEWAVNGFVSGPLVNEVLAGSVSAAYRTSDGWYKHAPSGSREGGAEVKFVRGKLLVEPRAELSILLSGYYEEYRDDSVEQFRPLAGNTVARAIDPNVPLATGKFDVWLTGKPFSEGRNRAGSVTIDGDLGWAHLTSLTAATKSENNSFLDQDVSPLTIAGYRTTIPSEGLSQEFNLASSASGALQWIAGAYFGRDKTGYKELVVNDSIHIRMKHKTEAAAAFGEVTYDITERLTGTLGVRFSHEEKTASVGLNAAGEVDESQLIDLGSHSWNATTPRAVLRYDLNDAMNVYFSYSQGFKSGAVNATSFSSVAVDPERIDAFELGLKGKPVDRLQLNAAAYYYDYRNIQVNTYALGIGGVPMSTLANAASGEIYGLDLDADYQITQELSLRSALSLLHARYDRFDNAFVQVPTGVGGNVDMQLDVSGKSMVRSPDWTLTLSAKYLKQLTAGALDLSTTIYHTDDYAFEFSNRVRQDAYTVVAATAAWLPRDTDWRFSVWGRNLTNEHYVQGAFVSAVADGVRFALPRTFGVGVEYSF